MKFECPINSFVRGEYKRSSDAHRLSVAELQEVLSYENISEKFDYCDWYGNCQPVTATISSVERNGDFLLFTVQVDKKIPAHYIPTPFQIMEGKGLLAPVSCSPIN